MTLSGVERLTSRRINEEKTTAPSIPSIGATKMNAATVSTLAVLMLEAPAPALPQRAGLGQPGAVIVERLHHQVHPLALGGDGSQHGLDPGGGALVVGRGRIQEPFDGIGALIAFVRERLLPQDRVAVMAFNRITDFTANHEQILAVLNRYAERHERIEALLKAAGAKASEKK